jgi:outer membrane protein assembly factor BamB
MAMDATRGATRKARRLKPEVQRLKPELRRSIVILIAALWLGSAAPALAQRDSASPAAPAVFLDTDPVAAKLLGAARDFLAARQWGDAVDLLRQIADQHGDRLVAIEPGRYVSVQTFTNILIAGMPAEGLNQYRAKTDPQARRWFEAARRLRDEEGLEKVVRKAFLSSYGDDALLLLGELAWEKGALARARSCWEKLIPPAAAPDAGELPAQLKYPDSEIDPALIKARLVLCSLMQGNPTRAQTEYAAFRELYPQASATLAGRHGNLAEILKSLLDVAGEASGMPAAVPETGTFAGNPGRNQVFPREVDVGGILWSVPLKEMRVERLLRGEEGFDRFERSERIPAALPVDVSSYYPVAWKNIVFYCDDTDIYACDLAGEKAGRASWGNEFSIYRLPAEIQQQFAQPRQRAGLPRFSLSIDRGRLYARLGTVAAPGRNRGFRPPPSLLVCLDLVRQGDLAWLIKAEELDAEGGKWIFDGAPVADANRVYAALRRNDPQLQLNVACFDAGSAKLLWNRKVCGGVDPVAGDFDEARHQLLTLAEERIYYCTNLGAVAALDARDGTTRWVTTYPRVEPENVVAFNRRQFQGPNPCVFHDGLIFAAPTDADRIVAYDAETGILKWEQELNGKVHQLIGVSDMRLIAAGDMLWALDAETGRVLWRDGRTDPEAATWGRGVIAGDLVYWPRREEIRIVDIASGEVRRQVNLAEQHGLTGGGNLTIAGDMLLCAQSDRLIAFSQFGVLKKPAARELVLIFRK